MTAVVASWPPPSDHIVITLDVHPASRYVSAECQLGAHWGCPGGLHTGDGSRPLICLCLTPGCSCNRHLTGGT